MEPEWKNPLRPRRSQVTPQDHEVDENYEIKPLQSSRNFPNYSLSSLIFPKLFIGSQIYPNTEIGQGAEPFTIEMEMTSSDLRRKFIFGNNKERTSGSKTEKSKLSRLHPDSFICSMRPFIFIAQAFAFLPVSANLGEKGREMKFKWLHWRIFHVIFNLSGVFFLLVCTVVHGINEGLSYDGAAPIVFYSSSVLGLLLFLDLARSWAIVCRHFAKTEQMLSAYGLPKNQGRTFFWITLVFVFCATVEHGLSKFVDIMKALPCGRDNENNYDTVYTFFFNQYQSVFSLFSYNIFLGIFSLYFNITAATCWNFMDLFLGLIGMSISVRLKQINQNLASVHGQEKPSSYWKTMREQFNAVSVLTKQVDQHIQKIMLLSLGDNLFFICLQLLKSLKKRVNVYQTIYFFWSFGFLLMRTCFVTLCASGIYDESRESKTVLYSVPQDSFCQEVRRFLTQLSTDDLTLTGCRFFSVTRGLMLTIAGTIVTYEIVLVQFKTDVEPDEWPSSGNKTSCAKLPI